MRHERLRTKFTLVMALVAAALIGAPHVEARAPHAQMEVGIRCQQEYQNNWQLDVGNSDVWRRCGDFNSQIGRPTTFVSISTCTAQRRRSKRRVMAAARVVAVPTRWIFFT